MYLEVKEWPESQEVMDDPEWFFIQSLPRDSEYINWNDPVGSSAYARIVQQIPELTKQSVTLCQDDEWQGGNNE